MFYGEEKKGCVESSHHAIPVTMTTHQNIA